MKSRKYPQHKTTAFKVAHALFDHGQPVTLEEGIAIHGETGLPSKYQMYSIYATMVNSGWLVRNGDKYELADYLKMHYCDLNGIEFKTSPERVQPRYHKEFTPMKVQPRDERLREISFVTVTG